MKLILENWRKYINENTTAEDYNFIITKKPKIFKIEVVGNDYQPVISKSGGNSSFITIEKRTDMDFYEVAAASSPKGSKGVGFLMYRIALELAGPDGLSPDSYETSKDALKIWNILLNDDNIEKKIKNQYDNEEDPFNNIYYDVRKDTISKIGDKITYKRDMTPKKQKTEKEPEPFDIEKNWEDLYDDEIFQ